MLSKALGKSGILLPEIGIGTWSYRGGIEPLRRGIAQGASLIDTAEAYGSEEIVGEAIRDCRERVFLATKALPRHFRRPDLIRAADQSLARLRTDWIDLYQLHWPNAAIPIEETMATMEELCDQGKVRFIGVSNFALPELKKAQAVLSRHRIVSNQVRYNLIERSIEFGLLRYCQNNGITILAYSPLAHGIHHIRENDPSGILRRVATETARTEAQVALNWCVSREGVIAVSKSDSAERVAENCGASGWRLSAEHIRTLCEEIRFRRRGRAEVALRRIARGILQRFGQRQ